jgi:hypothetical protein
MKFLEPVEKKDKAKGYVRLDMKGTKGNIIVSAENVGDAKWSTSEVYLYKDRANRMKLGDINSKKGTLKKAITFGSNNAIEEYNVCAVVQGGKIILYANLFNTVSMNDIKKLEVSCKEDLFAEKQPVEYVFEPVHDEKIGTVKAEEEIKKQEEQNDFPEQEELPEADDFREELNYENPQEEDEYGRENGEIEAAGRKRKKGREEAIYDMLRGYEQNEPLSVKIKNLTWWVIPYDEKGEKNGYLPFYNQVISYYYPYPMQNRVTTCGLLLKKYGHCLFGIFKENDEIKRYVYGVPGQFKREEQPYRGVTGFKNWSYKNKNHEGDYGYWLAFVDSTNGMITEPPQIELIK